MSARGAELVRWDDQSLRDVGAELGLSGERVRQIEIAALRKMREGLEALGFEEADIRAWLDSKAGDPNFVRSETTTYAPRTSSTHDGRGYRWREDNAQDDERIEAEAEAMVREIRATAAAHRFVERVVCAMEEGGEMRVLEERAGREAA